MIDQYQQRLEKIRAERLKRTGLASETSTTGSFSGKDIERIQEERLNRLTVVAESEFAPKPKEEETYQKKTEVVDKSAHWWDKTKEFLKKYPAPFDFIRDEGLQKTAKAIYKKAEKKAEEERAKSVGQRAKEGLLRGIQGPIKTDTALNWTARPITRTAASAITELTSAVGGPKELNPSDMGKAGEFIFGKDKIKPYSKQSEEINQAFGGKNPLTTVPIAAGMIALDFTGFGGKSKVANSIVKAATKEQAEKVIKKLGVKYSDDLAERIIKTTDAKQAASLLDDMAKRKSDPLIQEARKPIKVYHGTNADFGEFKKTSSGMSFFTSSKDVASDYGKNIKEAYLDIKNPKIVDMDGYNWFGQRIKDRGIGLPESINKGRKTNYLYLEALNAKRKGHDAIIFKNVADSNTITGGKAVGDTYVVFDTKNIKSQPLQEGVGKDVIEQQNKRLQILDQVKKEKVPVEIQKQVDEIPPERIKKIEEAFPNADSSFKLKANTAINVVKKDAKIKDDINAWLKNSYKGKAEAQKEAVTFKIKESPENILKHEAGEAYEGRDLVEKKFDELFKKAEDAGINLEKRQNYIPHVYNESPEEITKAVSKAMEKKGVPKEMIQEYLEGKELPAELAKSLKMNPFFSAERAFKTYAEAAEFGLTPKYKTMSQLVGHYTEKLNDVVANQTLIDDMVKHGHLSATGGNGKMAVNLPGNEGVYFAKPEVAGYLNDYFRNEGALNVLQIGAKYGAKLSKGLQNIVLAGGVPGTNLNFFTFGHVVKSLTTGIGDLATLNLRGALTNFKSLSNVVRSNFTKSSINWFNKRAENGILGKIANEGIDMTRVVGDYKETNRGFVNFFKNTKAKNLLGESYDKILQEKTFNSFLPMQTVSVFEDTYKSAIKKGLSEEMASKLAGDTTKNFMGLFNNLKGKTTQDAVSAVFFAPQFREGLIHTYWNTLKSLSPKTWLNPAFKQNRRLAIGMALTFFGGYDMLNQKLNGRHIWENPEGKKLELMIPGKDGKVYSVPFMPSQLAFFRNIVESGAAFAGGDEKTAIQKAGSNLSMGLKLITDVLGNKDYFGNEIYDNQAPRMEKYKDIAKYVGLNANHPYVKGLWNLYINHNAEQQPIYPMYQKITKLIDEGKREDAQVLIDTLDKEEKLAYEEMRKQKLKPLTQVMSEMMEVPLRFTNVGKLKSQEYYKKIDKISRDVKALPEGNQQTEKIQEYMNSAPESERRGILYALTKAGISTEGVSISEDIIRMKPVYNQVKDLVTQGKKNEAQKIINNLSEDDYKAYQKVVSSIRAKETKQAKSEMKPFVLKVKELAESGRKDEAKKMVNALTDDEYKIYKLVVESL